MNPATFSLFIGALASQGLGEQKVSGLAALQLDSRMVRADVRFDSARKVETGKGWIGTASLAGKVKALRLGGSFVHRDGGLWTKNTVWLEPGVAMGPAELTYRRSVSGQTENEQGFRVRLDLGKWVRWEGQVLQHHTGDVGYTSALGLRLGGK